MVETTVSSASSNLLILYVNLANLLNYEDGNWSSAMSFMTGIASGGLIPVDARDAASAAGSPRTSPERRGRPASGVAHTGIGPMPIAAGGIEQFSRPT